jgi:hypothetical protein
MPPMVQPTPPRPEVAPLSPPPSGGPQPPYSPPQAPPGGYYREGYEPTSVHSLPFVEKMGKAWVGIGWAIALASAVCMVLFIVFFGSMFSMAMNNPNEFRAQQEAIQGTPMNMAISALFWSSLLGGILFMVFDLIDRRGNFLWLIPQVICGCCFSTWLILPIYLLAGRKS